MSINITNEERIEIAENLRSMCAYGCKYAEQFYELLMEMVMEEWDDYTFGEVADRLAELVEPEYNTKSEVQLVKDSAYNIIQSFAYGSVLDDIFNDEESKMLIDMLMKIIEGVKEPERTCEWEWHEDFQTGQAGWMLNCGCWKPYEEELEYLDDEDSKPDMWNYCPRCSARVVSDDD